MTEVEISGGGHCTRLRDQLVCLWGAPSPVYKGVEEGAGQPHGARPKGGNPTPTRSRFPPFLVQLGGEGKGRGEEGKGGRPPPQFGWALGGRPSSWPSPLSSTKAH